MQSIIIMKVTITHAPEVWRLLCHSAMCTPCCSKTSALLLVVVEGVDLHIL